MYLKNKLHKHKFISIIFLHFLLYNVHYKSNLNVNLLCYFIIFCKMQLSVIKENFSLPFEQYKYIAFNISNFCLLENLYKCCDEILPKFYFSPFIKFLYQCVCSSFWPLIIFEKIIVLKLNVCQVRFTRYLYILFYEWLCT